METKPSSHLGTGRVRPAGAAEIGFGQRPLDGGEPDRRLVAHAERGAMVQRDHRREASTPRSTQQRLVDGRSTTARVESAVVLAYQG